MEYLIIVGFVAVILIPMVIVFYTYADNTEDAIVSNQINKISLKIADNAEAMYYLGEPSKTKIKAYFPKNIEDITIANNEVVFTVKTKSGSDEVVVYTPINITGSLDIHSGLHNILIEAKTSYVEISD